MELREQAYGSEVEDPLYVLAGRDEGYVPFYDAYPEEVARVSGRRADSASKLKLRTPSSACRVRGLKVAVATTVQRFTHPPHDVFGLVLGDHPDDDPAQFF